MSIQTEQAACLCVSGRCVWVPVLIGCISTVFHDKYPRKHLSVCLFISISFEILAIYLSLYLSSAHFLGVRNDPPPHPHPFISSPPPPHCPPPTPLHPLSTVRHAEFSPFGWRLGFIWKAQGKTFGRRALRREGKLRCGRFWGGAWEDREPGHWSLVFFGLSAVCESHGGALCSLGAPTVPTSDILISPGKTDLPLLGAPAPPPVLLLSVSCYCYNPMLLYGPKYC